MLREVALCVECTWGFLFTPPTAMVPCTFLSPFLSSSFFSLDNCFDVTKSAAPIFSGNDDWTDPSNYDGGNSNNGNVGLGGGDEPSLSFTSLSAVMTSTTPISFSWASSNCIKRSSRASSTLSTTKSSWSSILYNLRPMWFWWLPNLPLFIQLV